MLSDNLFLNAFTVKDVESDWKKIVQPEASHLCVKWEWLSIQKVQIRVGRIPQTLTRSV